MHHRRGPGSSAFTSSAAHFINTDMHVLQDTPIGNRLVIFGKLSGTFTELQVPTDSPFCCAKIPTGGKGLRCGGRDGWWCLTSVRGSLRGTRHTHPSNPGPPPAPPPKCQSCSLPARAFLLYPVAMAAFLCGAAVLNSSLRLVM